ncbi:hypothetical protein PCPL58_p5072 (plasmid) [Pseudomonas cerasi]|nr:hypothetical protein PCPL58_p5072 [Pseudomonas cerasi]
MASIVAYWLLLVDKGALQKADFKRAKLKLYWACVYLAFTTHS